MSYILDALRKSEEERTKSGARPARSGFTFIKGSKPTKKNKLAFGLILTSFMLLSALILGAGWWWSQKEQTGTEVGSTTSQTIEAVDQATAEAQPEPLTAALPTELSKAASDSSLPSPILAPSADEIPYLKSMSIEFQQKLPELNFSGHVYSEEPELRMIMINDVVVREGDPVETQLRLEKITADGVIMHFQKTWFRIRLF